jgi:hypothetical protein
MAVACTIGTANCSAISVGSSTIFSDLWPISSTGVVATMSRNVSASICG